MQQPISISGIASVSALGTLQDEVWQRYLLGQPLFSKEVFNGKKRWISTVTAEGEVSLGQLRDSNNHYRHLDRTVLLAMLAAKKAVFKASLLGKSTGINIGSSRGATQLFEGYHQRFLEDGSTSAYTSPTTTLGNISSWVGQELGVDGVAIDHSVTCSTAMHALLNGIAWLQANMNDVFLAGGSEAALTPFTMAQMQGMKLYSTSENVMACESMRLQKTKNTMVLGEGAAVAFLERGISEATQAVIQGYGFAAETLEHSSSISENGMCFQKSMRMALEKAELETVDVIVQHAPGTVKGDRAEYNAIAKVFTQKLPLLTSNKWLVGHTFAASGMLSIEMAILMLKHNKLIENPFFSNQRDLPKALKTIMINAVGFGGNAVSIILSKP